MDGQIYVRIGRKVFGPMTPERFAEKRPMLPVDAEVAKEKEGPWARIGEVKDGWLPEPPKKEPEPAAPVSKTELEIVPERVSAPTERSMKPEVTAALSIFLVVVIGIIISIVISMAAPFGKERSPLEIFHSIYRFAQVAGFFVSLVAAISVALTARIDRENTSYLKAISYGVIAAVIALSYIAESQFKSESRAEEFAASISQIAK